MQAPTPPPSESIRFRLVTRTRWSDEDLQGFLNNAVFSTLLEEGRFAYFEALGLLEDGRCPFLVAQSNVRFLAPGRGGVEVVVELATTRLGTSSFEQVYRVKERAGGKVLCEAEALLVCYDEATRKSRPMSEEFTRMIAAYEGLETKARGRSGS